MTVTGDVYRLDLEPGHLRDRTYASRRRRDLVDVSALLNLLILALFLFPSALIVPQLSTTGRPALLLGLLLIAIWVATKLHPQLAMPGPQPLRWAVGVWMALLLISYAAGQARGLTALEANGGDRLMLYYLVFAGIALACADGILSRRRLDDVVRILVWSGAIMAIIGFTQAILNVDFTQYIRLPGFVLHYDVAGLEARGGFNRVASTTGHYIEFSAVMAVVLPFAIHVARFAQVPLVRQLATVSAVLIAAVIPLTLSRTGMLAMIVMCITMLPAWSWRTRLNLLGMGAVLMAAATVLRPGFIGTLRTLFTNWSEDDSIQGRTERYDTVFAYVGQRPFLGRGPGTFVPDQYLILDNQWLVTLLETGVLGVAGLLLVHGVAIWLAAKALRRSRLASDRHLAACLITAQVVAVIGAGTFDSFAFTTFATTVAVCTGLAGTLWRLSHPARQVRTTTARLDRG